MSPRDIRSRFSCFVGGSGTLGGGVGGGVGGFSTYYNGTANVNLDFDPLTDLPQLNVSVFNKDNHVFNNSITTSFDLSTEWTWTINNLIMNADTTDDQPIFRWQDAAGNLVCFWYDVNNNRVRCQLFNQITNVVKNISGIVAGTEYQVIISSTGGTPATRTFSVEVVGLGTATNAADYSSYVQKTTQWVYVGGFGADTFSGSVGDVDVAGFDYFPFETRVQALADADLGKIVGTTNGVKLSPSNDRSYMGPYYTAGQYLVSDTP